MTSIAIIASRIKSFENRTTPKPAGAAGGFFYAWILTAPIDIAGRRLGIKEVDDGIWLASFMHYDLGSFDLEQKTLQPLDNPSARGCHPCLRYDLLPMSPGWTQSDRTHMEELEPPTLVLFFSDQSPDDR